MAIGSKVVGASVVAGQYGIINPEQTLGELSQEVRIVDPAATLGTIEQNVRGIDKAKTLVSFTQRVLGDGELPSDIYVPAGYVELNGLMLTCETPYNNISIDHSEGQNSTASMNVTYPTGAEINIPTFHGKPVKVLVHSDQTDITSPLIPLFVGWVETAKHNMKDQSISFTCSDLRAERLSREYQSGDVPDWAKYSKYVGGEIEKKNLWTAYLEAYSGNLGYAKDGELNRWDWDVISSPVDLTLTDDDVSPDELTTEFMTRSSVINEITIEGKYRWSKLWSVNTTVNAYNPRNPSGRAFDRSILLQKVESLGEWDLTDYTFYNLERSNCGFLPNSPTICIDFIWTAIGRTTYSQGIRADLVRRVAQPISEEYTINVNAPESIDAYGETVNGGTISFSIDNNYDGNFWETEIRERSNFDPETVFKPVYQARADRLREELPNAFDTAYGKARRKIVESHRQNYASCTVNRIVDIEVGDVVLHDNRILNVKGQCVGLGYNIADGLSTTEIKIAFCYLDTTETSSDYFIQPARPNYGPSTSNISSSAIYNRDSGVFDLTIADIPEYITDENTLERSSGATVKVNKTDVTLINGY